MPPRPRPRIKRNVQEFMNILYGPKLKVKLTFPEEEFFKILPKNHPLIKNKLVSTRNNFRRTRYSLLFDPRSNQNRRNFYTIYGHVKNAGAVAAPFRNNSVIRRAGQISNAASKVGKSHRKYRADRLEKKVRNRSARKIQTAWKYAPGGPGYRSAKAHFESLI